MARALKIVNTFLASPGDLSTERKSVKATVDEINKSVAIMLGFRIELMGWEDTLPSAGRPQAIINNELDQCELFIGMIWKRWGTPPDSGSKYSSGFEEEYARSVERNVQTGQPEIALYFKKIEQAFLEDPGLGLQRVLSFRNQIISRREVYFKEFEEDQDLQRNVRDKLTSYLFALCQRDAKVSLDSEMKQESRYSYDAVDQRSAAKTGLVSKFGFDFITELVSKVESTGSVKYLTPYEVARFRLLANSVSQGGNDDARIGVHDANLIFKDRQSRLTKREMFSLLDAGLSNIHFQNCPLWYWYSRLKVETGPDPLLTRTFAQDDRVTAGAFKAMTLMQIPVPEHVGELSRNKVISYWFNGDRSNEKRKEACRYLGYVGIAADLPLVESEYEKANFGTNRDALEAMLRILYREDKTKAFESAMTLPFDSMDEVLLKDILTAHVEVTTETLRLGLQQKNQLVRLESFKRLTSREIVSREQLQLLSKDSYIDIRSLALELLEKEGGVLDDDEAKRILIQPRKESSILGSFLTMNDDKEGAKAFELYQIDKLRRLPKPDLFKRIQTEVINIDCLPLYVYWDKFFSSVSDTIRIGIDDRFRSTFLDYVKQIKARHKSSEVVDRLKGVEDTIRKRIMRRALDLIESHGDIQDVIRVRKHLADPYAEVNVNDVHYIGKYGMRKDIDLLIASVKREKTSILLSIPDSSAVQCNRAVAGALYRLSSGKVEELFFKEMPDDVKVELLNVITLSEFSALSDDTILKLFGNKNDKIRAIAGVKYIQSKKKAETKRMLNLYLKQDASIYYNIVFWLDLGASLTIKELNMVLRHMRKHEISPDDI